MSRSQTAVHTDSDRNNCLRIMIRVDFLTDKDLLCGFRISGHAGGVEGTDIVCAAVSSAAYLVANTVTEILNIDAQINCEDGFMSCLVSNEEAKQCKVLFEGLRLHLSALAEEYPRKIDVRNTEV